MENKKRILLLTTGGTIACQAGEQGLQPQSARVMQQQIQELNSFYRITVEEVMCLDSSNMRPEQWQQIARYVYDNQAKYDGIVVSHGTDTMAYTASAVTFMLPGVRLPVVFTGSQLPLVHPLSDGPDNLRTAFAMAASGCPGVFLAFDRKIMLGCRAVKIRAAGFGAFESVNARYVGQITGNGLVIDRQALPASTQFPQLRDGISSNVFLLKLTPGMSPDIFDALVQMGYRGIVLEAFGLGGINVLGSSLHGIRRAVEAGVSVVVTTQCLYDSSDLRVYEVGSQLLEQGVLQGRDMTTEAAMTKLMWALGQGMDQAQTAHLFSLNLFGEISQ